MCRRVIDERIFDETIELKDNAILKFKPELFDQWDFEKNDELGLDVYKASRGSDKYAWWICPKCESSYINRISNRFNGKACSYCRGLKVNHTNSLASLNPELSLQWHSTFNGELTPHEVTNSSNKKVWWECNLNHEWMAAICDRKNRSCPYCSNKKVLKGYNDLWTTHPHISEMLILPELGYNYTFGSDFRTDWKCMDCNNICTDKAIKDVSGSGLSCHFCSDGFSYPEKFMSNLLSILSVDFIYQKTFKWSEKKVYDFYIPSLNMIIETHGEQHSIRSGFERMGGESLEYVQVNDEIKYNLATHNGVESYIVIDCLHSDFESIKNKVLKSNLIHYFDFSGVNWDEFNLYLGMHKSKLVEVCEVYNNERITKTDIALRLNISMPTLYRYLIRGNKIGLCEYIPHSDESKRISTQSIMKPVVQLDLDGIFIREFESATLASKFLNAPFPSAVSNCCRSEQKTSYGFKWMYKDDYDELS